MEACYFVNLWVKKYCGDVPGLFHLNRQTTNLLHAVSFPMCNEFIFRRAHWFTGVVKPSGAILA
jgi:hypothetical protein